MIYRQYIKRLIDVMISLIGLIVLGPLILLISLILLVSHKSNPFFFQPRPGKDQKIFTLIKFKTMSEEKDQFGELLSDENRLTGVGTIIRKTSLDECPQLLNVLWGDMSLIGPRPLLVEYLELYSSFQNRRHLVKPGITGWAQVNGRNLLAWDQKFKYDVWYVDHLSFNLDIKILLLTIVNVFKAKGISGTDHVTAKKFTGN